MIQIKNRYTGAVMHEVADAVTIREAVKKIIEDAVASGTRANLTGADLTRADLTGANLTGADLTRADLTRADLTWANLTGADLTGADLIGANLTRANLTWANLTWANLTGADLTWADLTWADLTWADLTRADLTWANLAPIEADLRLVLNLAGRSEVETLLEKLLSGGVDGSTYEGECACLVGTIANAKHIAYDKIPDLQINDSRPAERFFLGISKDDTPETSQLSAIAASWVKKWLEENPTKEETRP